MAAEAYPSRIKAAFKCDRLNFWQMDGLKGTVPLGEPEEPNRQISMDDLFGASFGLDAAEEKTKKTPRCKIYDWRRDNAVLFEAVGRERIR